MELSVDGLKVQVDLRVPPVELTPPAVAKVFATYAELVAKRKAAQAAVIAAERELEQARKTDEEAFATALRAGKRDPGRQHEIKATEKRDEADRQVRGVTAAVRQQEREVVQVVAAHREQWQQQAAEQTAKARQQVLDAVDAVRVARERLAGALELERWLHEFPRKFDYTPQRLKINQTLEAITREATGAPEPTSSRVIVGAGTVSRLLHRDHRLGFLGAAQFSAPFFRPTFFSCRGTA